MSIIENKLYPAFLKSTGISTDTRTIEKGNVFFALKGPNFNGNMYATKALEIGADLVILDEYNEDIKEEKVIYVTDVLKALQQLAKHHRRLLKANIIGLTGSNGKTTTKELLYTILKHHSPQTYCTQGNLNNHIGVPLTILTIPNNAEYAIIEMGTNQPGDIAKLADISEPDFGLITNIGKTHLEKLKSRQGVFEEKTSLFRKVKTREGQFFLNIGDDFLQTIEDRGSIKYSKEKVNDMTLSIVPNQLALTCTIQIKNNSKTLNTNLYGDFNIENIASALAVSLFFGVEVDNALKAISDYAPTNMRSQIVKSEVNTIVLDAYNSNPYSLHKALGHFINLELENRVAIIGDMLELGDSSDEEHRKVIRLADQNDEVKFIFVGQEFFKLKSHGNHAWFEDVNQVIDFLKESPFQNYHILIKGSRGIKLEKLLPYL